MVEPSLRQRYASARSLVAVTLNVTAPPAQTVLPAGWTTITGRPLTVSVTALLVADPHPSVTTTSYDAASAAETGSMVKLVAVAPETSEPFFLHWNESCAAPNATTLNVAEPPSHAAKLDG